MNALQNGCALRLVNNARVWHGLVLAAALVVLLTGSAAWAFYPIGDFDSQGELVIPRWRLDYMDVNGDGDVNGDDEGIEITFETGTLGWTRAEIDKLKEGFETWERVATSYAAFRYGQTIPNPPDSLETSTDFGVIDFINYVAIDLPDEPQNGPDTSFVVNWSTFVVDDVDVTINGQTVAVTGGQRIDEDIVYNSTAVRPLVEGEQPSVDLTALTVLAAAGMLGLGTSPMTNYDEAALDGFPRNIESRVVWLPNKFGVLEKVGVTPSTVNEGFYYDEGSGTYTDSHLDLAPDDIAGVTYLYPRGDADGFFEIDGEARTQGRANFGSTPIAGGHIIAWCDADNNPSTARVPLTDTLTSLYVANASYSSHLRGTFKMLNLFKQLQMEGGALFNATYTMTLSDPTYRPAPGAIVDSTHPRGGYTFSTAYPSETFREGGNLMSLERRDQGTPLLYDAVRRQVISANSAKTLEQMLPGRKPMFGDPNDICVLAATTAGITTNTTPQALRKFRDTVLLSNPVGATLADAYYRVSPFVVSYLVKHGNVYYAARKAAAGLEWASNHLRWIAAAGMGVLMGCLLGGLIVRRVRKGVLASLVLVGALLLVWSSGAMALGLVLSTKQLVDNADSIVTGTVTNVESHWNDKGNKIVTDITVDVADSVKGRMNKGSLLQIQQPGGRVGAVVTRVSEVPDFQRGEEVVLFLREKSRGPYAYAGIQSKVLVVQDPVSGEKRVQNVPRDASKSLAKKIQKSGAAASSDGSDQEEVVTLDAFRQYIRQLANQPKGETIP